ncbi:MAG: hypothetical protein DMG36_02720 [Acidobacteria bacterium]|nr:MAG: hypothetical protein DMG36_02720 [Acidobacteriota bacterium]
MQGWNVCGTPQVITDATRAHSGSNFLWASTSVYACAIANANQFVSVSPGQQLTFGGWTYLESGSSYLRWVLVAYDANNNQVGAAAVASPNTASPQIWTQEVGTYTIPSGATYVQIYCEIYLPNGTTAARFDDGFITFSSFAGTTPIYYVEDLLGTSRVITDASGVVCYDADFYPYGGERAYANTCTQNNYKFEGKERDTETGNDDFGARYYSNRFGRWLSADWSAVPAPVPYANLTNPQTLNLYSMVADDPESFADLDGHTQQSQGGAEGECAAAGGGSSSNGSCARQPAQDNATQQAQTERSVTVIDGTSYHGRSATTAYSFETTSSFNADGTHTRTDTATSAYFSNEAGHEGQYLGATQLTRVVTTAKDGSQSVTTSEKAIGQKQAQATVGNGAFHEAQGLAAQPNRSAYFGRAVAADAKAHPGKYVAAGGSIASLVLGPAGYPAAAGVARVIGLAGGLHEALTHWRP